MYKVPHVGLGRPMYNVPHVGLGRPLYNVLHVGLGRPLYNVLHVGLGRPMYNVLHVGLGRASVQPDVLFVRSQLCVFPSVGFISKQIMSFLFPAKAVRGLHYHKYTLPVPTRCQQEKQKAPPGPQLTSVLCQQRRRHLQPQGVSVDWVGKRKMQKKRRKEKNIFTNQFHEYSPLRKPCPFKNNLIRRTSSLPEYRHSQNIVTRRTLSLPEHRHSQNIVTPRTSSLAERRHSQNIVTPRTSSLPEHRHSQIVVTRRTSSLAAPTEADRG